MKELTDLDLLELVAKRIEDIAFEIPAPNPDTPKLVMLAIEIKNEALRRRAQSDNLTVIYDQMSQKAIFYRPQERPYQAKPQSARHPE